MVRIIEQIERDYDEALKAGQLSESGAMTLFDSDELVVVSRESLERMAARLEEVERELDERKLEESLAWFRSQGYTEDKLLSPEDLVDHTESRAGSAPVRTGSPRFPLFEAFGSFFTKRTKQAG